MKTFDLRAQLKKTKMDKSVGIGIAEIVKTKNISADVAKIKERVGAHYHAYSDEIYLILKGQGLMFFGKLEKNKTVKYEKPVKVKERDVFLIPKKTVHSLKNTEKKPLEIAFFSSPAFSPKDRTMAENPK